MVPALGDRRFLARPIIRRNPWLSVSWSTWSCPAEVMIGCFGSTPAVR